MENQKQQTVELQAPVLPQDISEQTNSVDISRRRFTKAGVAVSGVLLTLASRPSLGAGGGLGGGGVCKSPSGFMSGNVSSHGNEQYCSGRTPGYWSNHYNWPLPYKTGNCTDTRNKQNYLSWENSGPFGGTMFNDTNIGFHSYGNGSIYKTYSMMQVMLLDGNDDPYQLGAHSVAALLNAAQGWTPVLTVSQVRNMFKEWDQKGYFEPTAGVKWYAEDIVDYLQSTMTL